MTSIDFPVIQNWRYAARYRSGGPVMGVTTFLPTEWPVSICVVIHNKHSDPLFKSDRLKVAPVRCGVSKMRIKSIGAARIPSE